MNCQYASEPVSGELGLSALTLWAPGGRHRYLLLLRSCFSCFSWIFCWLFWLCFFLFGRPSLLLCQLEKEKQCCMKILVHHINNSTNNNFYLLTSCHHSHQSEFLTSAVPKARRADVICQCETLIAHSKFSRFLSQHISASYFLNIL